MRVRFDSTLGAQVTESDDGRVLSIRHSESFHEAAEGVPRAAAETYLRALAGTLRIAPGELDQLARKVSFFEPDPEAGVEYQVNDEKHLLGATTVDYYQTYHNTPVWRRGVAVDISLDPPRVLGVALNVEERLEGELPSSDIIERYRRAFGEVEVRKARRDLQDRTGLPIPDQELGEDGKQSIELEESLRGALAPQQEGRRRRSEEGAAAAWLGRLDAMSGKFFIYRFLPERRYGGHPEPGALDLREGEAGEAGEPPLPKLPPVDERIERGRAYLVAEVIFEASGEVWLVLMELETNSILYLERMTCGINGLVFRRDPMVSTGSLAITSNLNNTQLNPHRDSVVLNDLSASSGGTQSLTGTYVTIVNVEDPDIAAPTRTAGSNFDFNVRTNDFAAVNAYYHQTELFRTIESLGFPRATYFNGTTFPTRVDHRGTVLGSSTTINAHWSPNGSGGTGHQCYTVLDETNLNDPIGRACDPYVHWHEMGGHGTLGDHVGSGNLGFSHSHGDGLAAIQVDPESALRGTSDRFTYAPFRPNLSRRFDRAVGDGWAWGGSQDGGGYDSEQILATTHFRLYRSLGGDSDDLGRRQHAARAATYLILRTTGELTPGTNPSNWDPAGMVNVPGRGAQLWCERMQLADAQPWVSEGLSGGAYNKVIRWAFEKQGSYQPAGTLPPFTTEGAPPAVDVFIDDGRSGEYQYQAVHWDTQTIWNRVKSDGQAGHQNAIENQVNYAYVRVRNRGTQASNTVTVRAYHSLPGAGLTWPVDFVEMGPAGGLTVASIPGGNTLDRLVGPFQWTPNLNAYGHDCILMVVSTPGDPSNVDKFTAAQTIQEWRLVPHDNNIAQRNVSVVPGAGGPEALRASLNGAFFVAGNNLNRRAMMEIRTNLPSTLAERGWSIGFEGLEPGNRFLLQSGEKRRITIRLNPGAGFAASDIAGDPERLIKLHLYADDLLIGGMSYYIDPELKHVSGGQPPNGRDCDDKAQDLIECLDLGGGRKVKRVKVRKVSLDIELDGDCDCDC